VKDFKSLGKGGRKFVSLGGKFVGSLLVSWGELSHPPIGLILGRCQGILEQLLGTLSFNPELEKQRRELETLMPASCGTPRCVTICSNYFPT
jgi:hypothetical protein